MVSGRAAVRRLGAVALAALLLAAGGGASAAVTRGLRAPPLDARDGRTLLALRGRMVLLEFFGTRCPHCQKLAPRLGEIHRRYASRGLVVWGLTPDAPAAVDNYRREHAVRHPLSVVPMDTLRAYEVPKYPVLLLISPTGRVVWRGAAERLTDRVLDAYLGSVKLLPAAPPGQASIARLLEAGHYGAVELQLDRLRRCEAVDTVACDFVLATLAWIDWHRRQTFDAAERDLARGRPHGAWATYGELATHYAGTPAGERARDLQVALRQVPAQARLIDAEQALEVARRAGRPQTDADGAALLEDVARRHAGTEAAVEAARLARILRGSP